MCLGYEVIVACVYTGSADGEETEAYTMVLGMHVVTWQRRKSYKKHVLCSTTFTKMQ